MDFRIIKKDSSTNARRGEIQTDHGTIGTPIFMPVGTVGAVKAVHFSELEEEVEAEIILGNTYHLYLRPGTDVIEAAGGLHKFNSWTKPMLTDSGGYQVYSLSHRRKITEEGAELQSHIDGSRHFFSPERAVDIQRSIGADFIMAFDECTPYPCEYDYAKDSMHMTHRWLKRCCEHFDQTDPLYGYDQTLIPIVQGSTYNDLRQESAEFIAGMDRPANAIGGLSVGEPHEDMYAMTDVVCRILPEDKPRYLMGVGTPENILECIALGIDMFDCVMPTRNARHGMLYTSAGIINIKNKKWQFDFSPIDEGIGSQISERHSKAYLRHLMVANELLAGQIASMHNLSFYLWLVKEARAHIEIGDFGRWKESMVKTVRTRL